MKNAHRFTAAMRRAAGAAPHRACDHKAITKMERLHVSLAEEHGDTFFKCLVCHKELAKRSAHKHFTGKQHGLDVDVVKNWVVVSDGVAIGHGRHHKMRLTSLLVAAECFHVADSDEEMHQIASGLPNPPSWLRTRSSAVLTRRRLLRKTPVSCTAYFA